jgi:endoglycosylceramidase
MNAVRFLFTWAAVEPARGSHDLAYLAAVAERVRWAGEAGLLVVMDMHQDLYGEGFAGGDGAPRWTCDASHYAAFRPRDPWFLGYFDPNVVACFDGLWTSVDLQEHAAGAWRAVARVLANQPWVVGFDVLNEPFMGSTLVDEFEPHYLQPFYETVVEAVRGEAPGWVAFLEPSSTRNGGVATRLRPFPFPDVAYAPHSYDSQAEAGQAFDVAHRQQVLDHLSAVAAEARALGAALWVGEYGGTGTTPGIGPYMDAEYDGMAAALAGGAYWHHGKDTGYGLLNPDGSEKTALLDAVVRPAPARLAGRPTSWTYDDETRVLEVTWEPDPLVTAPSEFLVPARPYPHGFQVTCDGCRVEVRGVVVEVWPPPGAAVARVTVRPQP